MVAKRSASSPNISLQIGIEIIKKNYSIQNIIITGWQTVKEDNTAKIFQRPTSAIIITSTK